MTNPRLTEQSPCAAKRKKVLAAVTQELVTSEDDDNVAEGIDFCNIENHTKQHMQITTSSALHALGETIRNTLLEINEIREQNRERRHRELLQILTKMLEQESSIKNEVSKTKIISTNLENNDQKSNLCEYIKNEGFLEQDNILNAKQIANKDGSPISLETNLNYAVLKHVLNNQDNDNSTISVENSSSKCIQILPKSQIGKIKTVKQDNTKEELQIMRTQMLELQRKKMEDRERKKREFLQMKNI